ncbi:uncharacterized protein LOC132713260 [Ruditapes philippinarum]|uniref:uncharacterized protein LOC132713260 n=1 Tax=Ruditapes philippinarum TaxID=129788 RepID=UPI00295A6DFE|nr:uncharacterized protein LOC132713260 [Ruditapes philippinarum]
MPTTTLTLPTKKKSEISEYDFNESTKEVIGGIHIIKAIKELVTESEDDSCMTCVQKIDVDVFINLTNEEAVEIGAIHNSRQKQKKLNFQDKVTMCRKVHNENSEDWKKKAVCLLKCVSYEKATPQSCCTVLSVAGYSEAEYEATQALFRHFDDEGGNSRSFPQNLFRELQGVENKIKYLRQAYGTNGLKEARRCRTEKVGQLYKNFFCTAVQEDSWELAQKEYPEGCKQVERIAESENGKIRKYIPTELIELAEKCNNFESIEDCVQINIVIEKNGKKFENSKIKEIISKYQKKILKEIQETKDHENEQ